MEGHNLNWATRVRTAQMFRMPRRQTAAVKLEDPTNNLTGVPLGIFGYVPGSPPGANHEGSIERGPTTASKEDTNLGTADGINNERNEANPSLSAYCNAPLSPESDGVNFSDESNGENKTAETWDDCETEANSVPPGHFIVPELSESEESDSPCQSDAGKAPVRAEESPIHIPSSNQMQDENRISSGHINVSLPSDSPELSDAENTPPEQEIKETQSATLYEYESSLVVYLRMMYYLGMWPSYQQNQRWTSSIVQRIAYGIVCAISIINIIRLTKRRTLEFLAIGELEIFIALCLHIVLVITKVYFMWICLCRHNKFISIIKQLTELKYCKNSLPSINRMNRCVGVALGVSAVFLPILYSLFWFWFDELGLWTFKVAFQAHAYLINEFTSIWSSQNYENVTTELWMSLDQPETSGSMWLMGVAGLVISLVGRIQDYILCDVTLMIALSLHQAMSNCVRNIKVDEALQVTQTEKWNAYIYMKELAENINGLFGRILILIHVNNGLMISHFLLQSLNQEMTVSTLLRGVVVVKVLTICYLAMQTTEANVHIRDWFKDMCFDGRVVDIGGKKRSICVLLDDMSTKKIGLGTGEFFIDQKFVITFLTATLTFFVMLAELRAANPQ